MLKEFTSNSLVTNSIVELGEVIDDTQGKGRIFVSRFIEAGVAHYKEFGDVLITKETLDKFIHTMVGCPVIINHKDITEKNADEERVGVVCEVWFEPLDGWYYCKGIIWDKQAIDLAKNQGWNVSCTYDFESDFIEKTHNGKKIDMEFTNGKFLHLALVNNPRYERANIVVNSKEQVENEDKWITIHPNGEDSKGRPLLIKDGETPKEAMQRQFGAYDDQLTLDFKGAKEANRKRKIEENKKQMAKDKLYDAILADEEEQTNETEKKLLKAEEEYLKYFDDFETYDDFVADYEEEQDKKRADLAYKEMVKKQAEKTAKKEKKEEKKDKSILDIISERDKQAKELKEKGTLKDIKTPKSFAEKQQEDIDKGELVELGKFPTKFTSEYEDYKPKDKQTDTKETKENFEKRKVTAEDIGLEKTHDDGIKETQDTYGRIIFSKGNKWANVSSNGGRKDSWIASYGLTHASPVSWEKEKGVTEEQLLNSRHFKTEKGARKWALEQLRRITAQNDMNNKAENRKDKITMSLFKDLEKFVENAIKKCDEKEKFEEEETIVENEDKRKIIDEVGGILKDKVDEEVWRTVIGKLEKIAYEPSEDTKADNKCKNEDEKDEEEYEEMKEIAEDVEDKKEEKKEEEEKKEVKNSMDDVAKMVYGQAETVKSYTTTAERLELGNNY